MNKILLGIVIVLLGITSCNDVEAVDALTGKYEAPTEIALNNVVKISSEVDVTGLNHFVIELSGNSNVLVFEFVCEGIKLEPVTYTPAGNNVVTKNTYLLDGSSYNGSGLMRGNVTVEVEDDGKYLFSGVIWTADDDIVKFEVADYLE